MHRNELFNGACAPNTVNPALFPDHFPTSYTTLNANRFAVPHTTDQSFTEAAQDVQLAGMDNQRIYTALLRGDTVLTMVKAVIATTADDLKIKIVLKDDNRVSEPKEFKVTHFDTARISDTHVMVDATNLWRVESDITDTAVFNTILVGGADTGVAYQVKALEHAYIVSRNII